MLWVVVVVTVVVMVTVPQYANISLKAVEKITFVQPQQKQNKTQGYTKNALACESTSTVDDVQAGYAAVKD